MSPGYASDDAAAFTLQPTQGNEDAPSHPLPPLENTIPLTQIGQQSRRELRCCCRCFLENMASLVRGGALAELTQAFARMGRPSSNRCVRA